MMYHVHTYIHIITQRDYSLDQQTNKSASISLHDTITALHIVKNELVVVAFNIKLCSIYIQFFNYLIFNAQLCTN